MMNSLLKNVALALPVLALCAAINTLCAACASAPMSTPVREKGPLFTEVQGKEWKLIEVRTGSENIILDRDELISEGFGDTFTLSFEAGQLQGKGAPNRYRGPYEAGEGQALEIKNVAATLMAAIREPKGLKEHEYFAYLQNTYRWNIFDGNLELVTNNEDGREAVLVYTAE
jgi:heat shock protein HslJ